MLKKHKICGIIILIICMIGLTACNKSSSGNQYNKEVETAITAIKKSWGDNKAASDSKPYLEIKNTRIVFINSNEDDEFKDYDYVVEFILFSNYYGGEPYYENVGVNDSVVVYKDGHTEVKEKNPFALYRSRTYELDMSNIMKEVVDLGSEYNQVLDLEK